MDMYMSIRHVEPRQNVTRQWGTEESDYGYGIALQEGGFAVAGFSYGKVASPPPAYGDAVLTFVDSSHAIGSTVQWGGGRDRVEGMAQGPDGSLWIVGYTGGAVPGSAGQGVMFATRFDSSGNQQWTRQWGGAADGAAIRVAVDKDKNAYVVGGTEGLLDGTAALGGSDITCTKLGPDGGVEWIRQWGSSQDDYARDVALTTGGKVVVTGWNAGTIAGAIKTGAGTMFLTQLDTEGNIEWTRTFGAKAYDIASAVATTADGSIYVAGYTFGALVPNAQVGKNDVFLTKRNGQGEEIWTKQVGTPEGDFAYAISVAADGTIYVAGGTAGSFPGFVNQGSADNFVLTFAP
jgi:hypothetical protein